MKNVILLIGLIFSTIVNGQELTDAQYQTLLERNILKNASFANGKTGWFLSGGTSSVSSTSVDDSKSLSMVSSAQTLDVLQSITTNATNLANLQGIVKVYVKSNFSNTLQVCSYVNEANQSCVNVLTDNSWRLYEVPTILGATSSGVRIVASGSGSGTTLIDGAFVGLSTPFQNVSGAKLLGTLKYAGTANCIWSYSSATWGNYSADTDCATPSTTGALSAPGTKIPAFVLPAGSPAGTYQIVLNTMMYKGTSNGFGMFRFSDGTNSSNGSGIYLTSQGSPNIVGEIVYSSSLSAATTVQLQSKVSAGILEVYGTDTTDGLSFSVYYYPPESKIYSQNINDYEATQEFVAAITTTTGAKTDENISWISSCTAANPTVCTFNTNLKDGVNPLSNAPKCTYSSASGGSVASINSTSTTLTIGTYTTNGSQTASGNVQVVVHCSKIGADYKARGVIVGSFKDYVSTPTGGRVETFALGFGTTATTSCNASPCAYLDQIGNLVTSVTRTSAGNYTVNFSKTYSKVKCSYSPTSSGATNMSLNNSRMSCENCSSFSFTTVNGSGAATDAHGSMYCQGQL